MRLAEEVQPTSRPYAREISVLPFSPRRFSRGCLENPNHTSPHSIHALLLESRLAQKQGIVKGTACDSFVTS